MLWWCICIQVWGIKWFYGLMGHQDEQRVKQPFLHSCRWSCSLNIRTRLSVALTWPLILRKMCSGDSHKAWDSASLFIVALEEVHSISRTSRLNSYDPASEWVWLKYFVKWEVHAEHDPYHFSESRSFRCRQEDEIWCNYIHMQPSPGFKLLVDN